MMARLTMVFLRPLTATAAAQDASALYRERCEVCHDGTPQARMPPRQELSARTPEAIYQAMFDGAMKSQSAGLRADQAAPSHVFSPARNSERSPAQRERCARARLVRFA